MRFVTTRNNQPFYSAAQVLRDNAPDGGLFVPADKPEGLARELMEGKASPFNTRLAGILNCLLNTRLTGWDIDFCVGRYPVRTGTMSHRITVGECWHNPGWDFGWMAMRLGEQLCGHAPAPGDWCTIAIQTGILLSLLVEFSSDELPVDIVVPSGDLGWAVAGVYAREWGGPIENIVICCNENVALWDLVRRGELRTGAAPVKTATPLCDRILPENLERLIYAWGGTGEVMRYLEAVRRSGLYCPGDDALKAMGKIFHVSVLSEKRIFSVIPNLYRTNSYLCGPYTAMEYGGLLDYRASTGENRTALILSDRSPGSDIAVTAMAMGITEQALKKKLN